MIYAVNKRTKEHRVHAPGCPPSQEEEFVEADADGWIEWRGGECPLPEGSQCSIRLSSGDGFFTSEPEGWGWSRGGDQWIIAYRPILDAKPEAPMPEQGTDATTPRRPFLDSGRLRERFGPFEVSPPEWDGEGLPPVGCLVEAFDSSRWARAEYLKHHNGSHALFFTDSNALAWAEDIRPIRSEEDEAVHAMRAQDCEPFEGMLSRHDFCRAIYAAIRDGKIPGVKLEGGEG